jgi:hypothetical protein
MRVFAGASNEARRSSSTRDGTPPEIFERSTTAIFDSNASGRLDFYDFHGPLCCRNTTGPPPAVCLPVYDCNEDDTGRRVDSHALRVTFDSRLAASGTSLRTAMELMRHSDARLTTRIYTDPRLLDTAAAVNVLPRLVPPPSDREADRRLATGTGGFAASVASAQADHDPNCDPESLASGLVSGLAFCLPERVPSIGSRLASDGIGWHRSEQDGSPRCQPA